jgi:phenylalanyl-tRNA synthetase beta chain
VRRAVAGERIVSIDGTQCELESDMLVIADPKQPVAIAGVMGGLETEVGDATTAILLEDAYFDPLSVRRTSRRLSLPSEAAFRFERIVDIENVDWASKRAAELIVQGAGGKAAKGVVDAYPKRPAKRDVTLRFSRVGKLLGVDLPVEEGMRILSALSFEPRREDDLIVCTAPSWRSDICREVDLIEEVARVYGYDRVPVEKRISIEVAAVDGRQRLTESIGRYLNGCGFYEAITVGFVEDWVGGLFTAEGTEGHLAVQDVSRKTANLLRQTVMGSLLGVLKTNVNAKNLPCSIFEIANTFVPRAERSDELPVERTRVATVSDGDFRELRGAIEGLIKNVNREADVVFTPAELVWAQSGAEVVVDGNVMGTAGVVSRAVRDKYGFKEVTPVAAEVEFEQLLALQSGPVKVRPIPRFPAIERDLSIIVAERLRWVEIVEAVSSKAPDELEDIQFVDIYRGKGIPSDKKSVTLSLRFRDEDGTLTHDSVDGFEKAIVESLAQRVKAELRTV